MDSGPIRSVAIAGSGIVGWSAAAALRKALPGLAVTVVAAGRESQALSERITCALPSIVDFHGDVGLDDLNVLARAHSGLRLGTCFAGWPADQPDYVHAYGDYGGPIGSAAFHQHWLRAERDGDAGPFDSYSVAAEMGRNGRLLPPEGSEQDLPQRFAYGLHIDPPRYREMMRAFALHLGASECAAPLEHVRLNPDGAGLQAIGLEGGGELTADLFVDAGGLDSPLRKMLGGEWADWSQWLVCDRVLLGSANVEEPTILDKVDAVAGGWTWSARAPTRTSVGTVYSSSHLSDDSAAALLGLKADPIDEPIAIKQGRWADPWVGNCVAIGDSAVMVEPLEWTNLHLAHSAIDRLVAMIPDRSFNPIELWDYNRQAAAEADRVRDFLVMHYVTANRNDEPFWETAAGVELPQSLAHTLTQFRERGRLPFYEEETFSRNSWLAVLLGQGVRSRRTDPLVDATPSQESARLLAQMRQNISTWVQSLPPQARFLDSLRQNIA